MTKVYSTNDEEYSYTEVEDAIRDALDDPEIQPGECIVVYEADKVSFRASDFAPSILENLGEAAYSEAGEYADEWPACSLEEEQDLQCRIDKAVDDWAQEHGLVPDFYTVKNSKSIKVRLLDDAGNWEFFL